MPLILKRPRFDPLAVKMRKVARGLHRQAVAGAIRDEIEKMIDSQFDQRRSPEGRPWAPRKPPTGSWPLLQKTGKMRRDYHVVAKTTGVTVTNNRPYASYHQTGTRYMPARKVAPDGALPASWSRPIDAAVATALDKL